MIDDILLTAITRFWSTETVTAAYERILAAYSNRVDKVVIITGKTTDSDSASAQVVIQREDYREWMATLEGRLKQIENAESGADTIFTGTEHVTHHKRYVTT
jgi:PHD/YefM family antitoxin component YafN of YafNO toxin-antitoxin module